MGRSATGTPDARQAGPQRPYDPQEEAQGAAEAVLSRWLVPAMLVAASVLAGIFLAQDRTLKNARADLATTTASLATCQAEKASITAAAAACSRSVEEAVAMAAKRAADAQAATAAALAREHEASKRVAALLRRRPVDPDDLCKSADGMLTEWIKGRAKQ